MVVGADVEALVVVRVLPDGNFIVRPDLRRPRRFFAFAHGPEPAPGRHGLRLEKFQRSAGRHFRRNHRGEIFLKPDDIDDVKGVFLCRRQFERSAKRLLLGSLPVKADADGDVADGEKRSVRRVGQKANLPAAKQFAACGVAKKNLPFRRAREKVSRKDAPAGAGKRA